MIKGTGKRMVPERDIKYLEDLKANHSDPTASWGGTEVEANPTPGEDDPALTGLQVGDSKYKVPEEKKFYRHIVYLSYYITGTFSVSITTSSSTPFTTETFIEYLNTNGYINNNYINVVHLSQGNNFKVNVVGINKYTQSQTTDWINIKSFDIDTDNNVLRLSTGSSQIALTQDTVTLI